MSQSKKRSAAEAMTNTVGGYFLSLDVLADRIEEDFANRTPPIVGTNGHRLKATSIKRHALNGLKIATQDAVI